MKRNEKFKHPKISVIVPVYNVEKYLEVCVDSILAQSLKEIEVILIDDGSPDNCGKIIDDYAKKDKRVIPVHQKNKGYSAAVNYGIRKAKGEYIGIIESDDWIEPDMYEELYKSAKKNKTDITKGEFWRYNSAAPDNKRDSLYDSPRGVTLELAPEGAFRAPEWPTIIAFHSSIWSSIYRAEYVKKKPLPETKGASYQDFPFMLDVMCNAAAISVVKKPFVHWRNEPGQGNSTSAKGQKLILMAKNTQTGLNIIKNSGCYEELKEAFYTHAFWANINFFFKIEKKYRQEYYNELRKVFINLKPNELKYVYLRDEDKPCIEALIEEQNCRKLYRLFVIGGLKRKITKLFTRWKS